MNNKFKFIPVCEPFLNGNEKKYVLDALESGWISSAGKYIEKFEVAFAEYIGVKHAISVTNGTNALHLALVSMGIGEGDEVILPDFTMIASAFAIVYTGAIPVFVDSERETWNIDVNLIERKITEKTKAIMAVHIYGHPSNMAKINEIAKKYNLLVIEDAAEVHGATVNGEKCGALGDIAAFSFFANKIITTGEGGMVVTNNDEFADKCRYYKNLCFPRKGSRKYVHENVGFNYRMSNLHAALGLAQLEKIEQYVELRRRNHDYYYEFLKDLPGIIFQKELPGYKNVYWMNSIVIDEETFGKSRDFLREELSKRLIDTRPFFIGLHKQPSLKNYSKKFYEYKVTEWLSKSGLYLPSASSLDRNTIKYICDTIWDIYES